MHWLLWLLVAPLVLFTAWFVIYYAAAAVMWTISYARLQLDARYDRRHPDFYTPADDD